MRPWLVALTTGVVAAATVIALAGTPAASFPPSWWWLLLIPGFAIGEVTQIHFEFRHQTVYWSLSEVSLVIGLITFGVVPSLISSGIAVALVLSFKRYSAPKILFNVALAVIESALAGSLLVFFGWTEPLAAATWFGAILILMISGFTGLVFISGAILATEGGYSRGLAAALLVPLLVVSPLATALGVLTLITVELSPWGGILAVFILAAIVALYRRYAAAAQDRRSLAEVYEFSESIRNTGDDSDGELVILAAVREKFNAARAALWIPPYLDQGPRLQAVTEDENNTYPGPDDPDDVIRLKTTASQVSRLVAQGARPTTDELAALRRRGVRELIGVPLEIETSEPGYLEVCDRNGSVLQFSAADVELMQSLATHVAGAVRARQLLDKIRYDAAHDQVTDLPNRFWLTASIDAHLDADALGRRLALIVAEIDGFAQVNETLGHVAGDELLRVIAAALSENAPADARVARVGGAQFAVLLPDASLLQAEVEAARLASTVSSRVQVSGLQLSADLTLGVAVAPQHGTSSGPLLQHADVALLAARTRGLATSTYSPAMDQQSLRRLQLGGDLAEAIESSQISVAFQPIVGAGSGEIAAVELLARWTHPRLGSVSPDEFIPLAERIGLITPLTRRVLATALKRGQAWLDEGIGISMAVNLSSVSLVEPGFVDEVARTLREHAFPAELLTFEITEGSVIGEALALPALKQLHELGLGLSVDDFGTGYSSLSYLRRLPIDEVKIDKSFVLGMSTDPGTNTIARSIIDLAHSLGLRVVAEGVEDDVTRDLLTNMNCDFLQGYLISRPLTERNLLSWLSARTTPAPADRDRHRRKLYIRG